FFAGANFDVEIASAASFDRVTVTGAVVIGTGSPGTSLNVSASGTPTIHIGDLFVIMSNDGTDSIVGRFVAGTGIDGPAGRALPEGALLSNNFLGSGLNAYITYAGGLGGNDVAILITGATHFAVAAPASATNGTPFDFTVTALDQFDTTVRSYAGTVHFTSSDAAASLPANATLTNGAGTFSATLRTAGNQT